MKFPHQIQYAKRFFKYTHTHTMFCHSICSVFQFLLFYFITADYFVEMKLYLQRPEHVHAFFSAFAFSFQIDAALFVSVARGFVFLLHLIVFIVRFSFQGFSVSLFYCFLNSEVRNTLKHRFNTWRDERNIRRGQSRQSRR